MKKQSKKQFSKKVTARVVHRIDAFGLEVWDVVVGERNIIVSSSWITKTNAINWLKKQK